MRTLRRYGILALLLALITAGGWATGIVEYVPPDTEDQAETDTPAETAAETEAAAAEVEQAPAPRPRPAPFVPTVQYPDTLFLPIGPRVLGDTEIEDFLAAIEADRRLLSELRKPVPQNREDAVMFLNGLKELAVRADPIRLAIVANRVLEQAPIYFDWLETEFETPQDEVYEYHIGGVQGFSRALEEFQNAVLMTAINRLDIASRIIQESNSADE